jgi:hypothetical protein
MKGGEVSTLRCTAKLRRNKVADEIDRANEHSQLILDKQIELAKQNVVDPFQNISGTCWECNAHVSDGRRWCSTECRDASEL